MIQTLDGARNVSRDTPGGGESELSGMSGRIDDIWSRGDGRGSGGVGGRGTRLSIYA